MPVLTSIDLRADVAHRGKPGEVPVESHHVAMVLSGYGREHGVGYQITGCVGLVAEFTQQREVAWAGTGQQVVGLGGGGVDECERLRAW